MRLNTDLLLAQCMAHRKHSIKMLPVVITPKSQNNFKKIIMALLLLTQTTVFNLSMNFNVTNQSKSQNLLLAHFCQEYC